MPLIFILTEWCLAWTLTFAYIHVQLDSALWNGLRNADFRCRFSNYIGNVEALTTCCITMPLVTSVVPDPLSVSSQRSLLFPKKWKSNIFLLLLVVQGWFAASHGILKQDLFQSMSVCHKILCIPACAILLSFLYSPLCFLWSHPILNLALYIKSWASNNITLSCFDMTGNLPSLTGSDEPVMM